MNPWAVADVAGGVAVDAAMVATLAGVYGIGDHDRQRPRAGDRDPQGGRLADARRGGRSASARRFFKGLTFGGSTVLTALPQGAAAGYGSYLVGQAARCYFEQGASWGEGGPKRVVRQILDNTDKRSVVDRLKGEIRKKLARNRHGDAAK